MRPTILGPPTWPGAGPPPRFAIDAGGPPLYMVELAATPDLMRTIADRTVDNYFFGGDADSAFATGPGWCVPAGVWCRLGRTRVLYYRVVTFDHISGTPVLSVDDQQLATLPMLLID